MTDRPAGLCDSFEIEVRVGRSKKLQEHMPVDVSLVCPACGRVLAAFTIDFIEHGEPRAWKTTPCGILNNKHVGSKVYMLMEGLDEESSIVSIHRTEAEAEEAKQWWQRDSPNRDFEVVEHEVEEVKR